MRAARLAGASAVFWLPVVVFSYIASEVLERQPLLFDSNTLYWIHRHSNAVLGNILLVFTTIGNVEIITPLALLICTALYYRRLRPQAAIVSASFFGAAVADFILKLSFHRHRPDFWTSVLHETGYSFPSGHAMLSSALVFSLIAISWNSRYRYAVLVPGLAFVVAVGYSRLYFGVHYPTDILAGWLASFVWVAIVVRLTKRYEPGRVN